MTANDERWNQVVDHLRKPDVYAVVVPKGNFDSPDEMKDFKQMATPDLRVADKGDDLRVTAPDKPEGKNPVEVKITKDDEKKAKRL